VWAIWQDWPSRRLTARPVLQEQIDEITDVIAEMKLMRGKNFTIKQSEKPRRSLEARMEKLQAAERKDDVITFCFFMRSELGQGFEAPRSNHD